MSENLKGIYDRVNYDEVSYYLRHWINASGDSVNYDFGGIIHLLIACFIKKY